MLGEAFDLVYVTWWTINWLGDLGRWAGVVAGLLRSGGALYLLDTHPQLLQVDQREGRVVLARDWQTPMGSPLEFQVTRTYIGGSRPLRNTTTYQWVHPLGTVITAIVDAGLNLNYLHVHETISWKALPSMNAMPDGQFALPYGQPSLPLCFSVSASKA